MSSEPSFDLQMQRAFRDGTLNDASNEQLTEFLKILCNSTADNDRIKHVLVIRGITINHIQQARIIASLENTIKTLNAQNTRNQRIITFLAILGSVGPIIGLLQVLF